MPAAHPAVGSGGKTPFLQLATETENITQHDRGVEPLGNQNCFVARILVQGAYDQVFQLAVSVLCIHTFGGVSKITMGAAGAALNRNMGAKKRLFSK